MGKGKNDGNFFDIVLRMLFYEISVLIPYLNL